MKHSQIPARLPASEPGLNVLPVVETGQSLRTFAVCLDHVRSGLAPAVPKSHLSSDHNQCAGVGCAPRSAASEGLGNFAEQDAQFADAIRRLDESLDASRKRLAMPAPQSRAVALRVEPLRVSLASPLPSLSRGEL